MLRTTWEAVTDLHKHREEDDSDDGGEEHVSHGEVISPQQVDQGEGDRSSQSTVSYDKLVLRGEFDDTELVDHEGQADNTFEWSKTLIKHKHQPQGIHQIEQLL